MIFLAFVSSPNAVQGSWQKLPLVLQRGRFIQTMLSEIFVPNGHRGNSSWTVDPNHDGLTNDLMIEIPQLGRPDAIRCPASWKVFLQPTIGSGNQCGSRLTVDGDRLTVSIFFARLWHYRDRRT